MSCSFSPTDAQTCPGRAISLTISRRLRNPLYVGNVVGDIPADTLSGGASVSFYSAESTVGQVPQLRLLLASSLATGVMSAALPGRVAASPTGRRMLGADPDSQLVVSASLSNELGVPVTVSIASYSIYAELIFQGLSLSRYQSSVSVQTAIQSGITADVADPDQSNVYVKSSTAVGPNAVKLAMIIDGYDSAPDNGFTAATRDQAAMVGRPATFFANVAGATAASIGVPADAVTVTADPSSIRVMAAYQVLMNASVGMTGNLEAAFNNAVQSGAQCSLCSRRSNRACAVLRAGQTLG